MYACDRYQADRPVDTPLLMALSACPLPCSNFVGRNGVYNAMRRMRDPLLDSEVMVFVIHGPPGIGKSQIAFRFVQECTDAFSAVIYIDASTQKDLFKDLSVDSWLGVAPDWLMVIDNLDSIEPALGLIQSWKQGRFILTTRTGLGPRDQRQFSSIKVKGLEIADAMQLLGQMLGLSVEDVKLLSKGQLTLLLMDWCCFPLMIAQLGQHIMNSSLTLEDYCTRYIAKPDELIKTLVAMPSPTSYRLESLAVCLQECLSQLDFRSVELLEFWATLDRNGFKRQFFQVKSHSMETYALQAFREMLLLDSPQSAGTNTPISSLFLPFDNDVQDDLVQSKSAYKHIWPIFFALDVWTSNKTFSRLGSITGVLFLFQKVTLDSSFGLYLASWANRILDQISNVDELLIECSARSLDKCGWWVLSQKLWLHILRHRTRNLGPEHPKTLLSMANLASIYQRQGLLAEAKKLQLSVLKARRRDLGEDHLDTLTIMHELAATLLASGLAETAEDRLQHILELRVSQLGEDHPDVLSTRHSLALVYLEQCRWQDAADLNELVLEKRRRVLGKEHPDTLSSHHNLVLIQLAQSRQHVMTWKIGALDDKAIDDVEWMWSSKWRLNSVDDYLSPYEILEARRHIIGVNHPDTLFSMLAIALIYQKRGQWGEATKIQARVLEIQKQLFGSDHPITSSTMLDLASMYDKQGLRTASIALQEEALSSRGRVFGKEHRDTMQVATMLISTYWNDGRWKEAEALHQDLIQTQKQALGDDHSDTLNSMLYLAERYMQQCRWQEASELFAEALEGMRIMLGSCDPETEALKNKVDYTRANSLNDVFEITPRVPSELVVAYFVRKCGLRDYTTDLARAPYCSKRSITNGGSSDIFRAKLEDDTQVAVKCIRLTHSEYKRVKHTTQELNAWSKIEHENVVPLLGLALFENQLAMISPWSSTGHIMKTIGRRSFLYRSQLCIKLIAAIVYLHDNNIVHGDLKGENILMSDEGSLQLTDFGLTIVHDENIKFSKSGGGKGTTRWMAPELMLDDADSSKETDIYAMGMTMLEIMTGNQPFHEFPNDSRVILAVGQGKRPQRPSMLSEDQPNGDLFWCTLQKCWEQEPCDRPSAREVQEMMAVLET